MVELVQILFLVVVFVGTTYIGLCLLYLFVLFNKGLEDYKDEIKNIHDKKNELKK